MEIYEYDFTFCSSGYERWRTKEETLLGVHVCFLGSREEMEDELRSQHGGLTDYDTDRGRLFEQFIKAAGQRLWDSIKDFAPHIPVHHDEYDPDERYLNVYLRVGEDEPVWNPRQR